MMGIMGCERWNYIKSIELFEVWLAENNYLYVILLDAKLML